jgi:hypothetical protein
MTRTRFLGFLEPDICAEALFNLPTLVPILDQSAPLMGEDVPLIML